MDRRTMLKSGAALAGMFGLDGANPMAQAAETTSSTKATMIAPMPSPSDTSTYPTLKSAFWTIKDFRFRVGPTLPELKIHYYTIGEPSGLPVLISHGTGNRALDFLSDNFGGQLFGPGQTLDARKYFIIIPDAIGHGESSKPSDGMRMEFPRYTVEDMMNAQYQLVTQGLGIKRLHLKLGHSMGGMITWLWSVHHSDFIDAAVPMAAQPAPMSGRDWIMRRLIIDGIRQDPEWQGGKYTEQPRMAHFSTVFFGLACAGGTLALQHQAPTRAAGDDLLDKRLAAPFQGDANDLIFQWDSSRDYDPSMDLSRIKVPVLAILAAEDERNPLETGIMRDGLARIKNAQLYVIPASIETPGHTTTTLARFWQAPVRKFLAKL